MNIFKSFLRGIGIFKYDVALSFAEEQRAFVERVASYLQAKGIRFFYDKDRRTDTWGKDLRHHLDDIYREGAQFCVMFISKEYKEKRWSKFEQKRSLARAFFSENREYLLPFKFDDTEIAGLEDSIAFLPVELYDEEKLAEAIIEKIEDNRPVWSHIRLWLKWYFAGKLRTAAAVAIMVAGIIYQLREHFVPVDVLTERIHEESWHTFRGSACKDGWLSTSQGSGSCSGHGGVDYKFEKDKYGKALKRCRKEAEEISWMHTSSDQNDTEEAGENPTEDISCALANGTYTANVVCTSTTKHTYTDTPEIEVADCRLVRIYYPKDHRRDETNMSPVLIGKDSNALARDKAGNEYRVHITHASSTLTEPENKAADDSHICGHLTKKGKPCQRKVNGDQRYCYQHR